VITHTRKEEIMREVISACAKNYHPGFYDASADDCIQETHIRMIKNPYDENGGASEETFIRNTARYAVLDYLRTIDHLSRGHRSEVIAGEAEDPQVPDMILEDSNDPIYLTDVGSDEYADPMYQLMLEDAINARHQRNERVNEMMRLHYLEGITLKAIGDMFGIGETRVWQLIDYNKRKWLKKLRSC